MTQSNTKTFATKIATAAFALATIGASMAVSTSSAEARWGHRAPIAGVVAGGLALGLIGAAIANGDAYAEDGDSFRYRRVCRIEPRYNDFGEFVGSVRVCRTGGY